MPAIDITPEVLAAINEACSDMALDNYIVTIGNAEEALQKVAYEEFDSKLDYLFRFAYELRLIREKFEQLEKTLGYEPNRD